MYLISVRLKPALAQHPIACGVVFGILVFLAMRLVVLPASALAIRNNSFKDDALKGARS